MRNIIVPFFIVAAFNINCSNNQNRPSFCNSLPRPAYTQFEKHVVSDDWFEVYEVDPGIFAIYEPFQWQEVISYLILGSERALLFDTGNGIGNIRKITDQLTELPISVLNSHTHYDHIGDNYRFEQILAMNTAYTRKHAQIGYPHESVAIEVSADALCHGLPEGVEPGHHHIPPFSISQTIENGHVIDLGNRKLEVIHIPGHTPDAIALLDSAAKLLWTGDSFYAGPIWLWVEETDLEAYENSLDRLVGFVPNLRAVLPAHNTPWVSADILLKVRQAFADVKGGKVAGKAEGEELINYPFEGFSFLLHKNAFISLEE